VPLPIVAIFGPTGVGKTAVAVALARRLRADGEDPVAISADALQLYAGLEILTGAADEVEQAALEHRLLGILPLTATATAGEYAELAHREVDQALEDGRRPIVIGGTGLYLRAALADLDLRPPVHAQLRARHADRPVSELREELSRRDPQSAARIAKNDRQRLVRALELLDAGQDPPGGDQLWTGETRHPTLLAGLTMERATLYARIDARVDAMVAAGAGGEVRRAAAAGAGPAARQALGFEELLRGDVEAMRARTRRYARRQLTWMRKLPGVELVDVTGRAPPDVAAELHAKIRAS
jgi:tRNA dimethylallyltransferase